MQMDRLPGHELAGAHRQVPSICCDLTNGSMSVIGWPKASLG
jgi:hypothetical protein